VLSRLCGDDDDDAVAAAVAAAADDDDALSHLYRTKLFFLAMKTLTFWTRPLLYSYQSFLPSLPGLFLYNY
jgi:hypothetical protein